MQAEHNMCAAAMLWRNTPDADMLLQAWWDVGVSGCCPTFPHDQTALKHMLLMYLANVTGHSWLYPYSMRRRFKLPATPPPAAAMPVAPAAGPAAAGAPPGSRPLTAVAAATAAAAAPPKQQRQHKQQHKQKKLRVLSKDHMPHKVSTWAQLRPLLQERRAAVGFVGIDVHAPTMLGAAHNIHAPAHNRAVLHNCVGMWWGCVPLNTPSVLYHTGHWAMVSAVEGSRVWGNVVVEVDCGVFFLCCCLPFVRLPCLLFCLLLNLLRCLLPCRAALCAALFAGGTQGHVACRAAAAQRAGLAEHAGHVRTQQHSTRLSSCGQRLSRSAPQQWPCSCWARWCSSANSEQQQQQRRLQQCILAQQRLACQRARLCRGS
jgi:hypothetical protein